jgi:zinc transport system substrate-binding protein
MTLFTPLSARFGAAVIAAVTALARGLGSVAIVVAVFVATPATAAEKVIVSTPPLHSLVSSLLEGVDTPGLLYRYEEDVRLKQVSFEELARLEGAELVIWVGREYEQALDTIVGLDRSLASKGLTLSKTVPLHAIPDPAVLDRPTDRHDMRFWLDPKLAAMAVRRIAPALVKVYPEQVDRILDNEIDLVARIGELAGSMRQALDSKPGVPLHYTQSDVLYLARRFNLPFSHCAEAARRSEGFLDAPGSEHYFNMMRQLVGDLKVCRSRVADAG